MEFNRLCLFVFSLASAIAGVSAQGATGSGSMCANMETIEAACDACCGAGIYCKESPDDSEFVFCGNTIPACGNTIGKTQSQQECQCGSQTTCNAQDYCLENGYLNYPNELPDTCLTDCPIGSVLDETCKQCPTGYSYNSSLTCDACPEGRYSDKEGSVGECKLCPGGKYAKSTNSTACTDCGKGKQLSQGEDASSHGSESKCTDCVSGKYARNTGATNCVECASAKTTGATTCEGCPPGKSVKSESTGPNGATTYVCEDCTLGSYNSQQNAASCTTCPKGYFADTNNERDKCDACTRGHFGTVEEAKTKEEGCKKCLKGSFSNDEGMEHCPNCPKGRYGDETGLSKESLCKNCDAGKIGSSKTGANASTSCQDCSTGRYNKNVGEFLSSSCKSCPKGYQQDLKGEAFCLPCVPGKFSNQKTSSTCTECAPHTFSNDIKQDTCKHCPLGWNAANPGSARCSVCAAGRYGHGKKTAGLPGGEQCTKCPTGWKRSEDDTNSTTCMECENGQTSKIEGATACTATYPLEEDCDYTNQYLNNSSPNKNDWECKPCPVGGYCEGLTTWRNVRAKYGWWRVHDVASNTSTSLLTPPEILNDNDNKNRVQPMGAFEKCIFAHACHGEKNPGFYVLASDMDNEPYDPAGPTSNLTETCNEKDGYRNNCTNPNGDPTRCRLCATCKKGFKRNGRGTQCKLCPDPTMNKVFLAIGFVVMVIGSGVLIYMAITTERSGDDTSEAIKKIIVNFLQMVSLAGGLPLQWPSELNVLFDSFASMSSAGTTLMIPDCELTNHQAASAFYMKQIAYMFAVPVIVLCCVLAWVVIRCFFKQKLKLTDDNIKDYTVLSIVLGLFLCWPTLVTLTLAMLKCPQVGKISYLMADLQEPCFTGRHQHYLLLVTLPQLLLYVFGLPLSATAFIIRNKAHLHKDRFFTRYGLLYMGYREDREWWELVIALRKVAVVSVGTFGTVIGAVNLQAFVALGLIFLSIIVHLVGQPFNTNKPSGQRLHQFEFAALTVCWCTFWGGLLFFLKSENPYSIGKGTLIFTSIVLVVANMTFLMVSLFIFIREYLRDRVAIRHRRRTRILNANKINSINNTAVTPVDFIDESSGDNVNNTAVAPVDIIGERSGGGNNGNAVEKVGGGYK